MAKTDDRSSSEKTLPNDLTSADPGKEKESPTKELSFLPDETLSEQELRKVLAGGPSERRLLLVRHIVAFAPWEEIWTYLDPDELREMLPDLDLPASLKDAWQTYLNR